MLRPLAVLLAALVLAGCNREPEPPAPKPVASIPFRIDGQLSFLRGNDVLQTIDIEVADTDSTRARGLMHRFEIPEDTGMLFVFPNVEVQGFYMMNTPRSLDIQFYGPDSTLINIAEDTVPYSLESVYSAAPTQFVVEVPAGYSRRIGLVPGDRIRWTLGAKPGLPAATADSVKS
jgi:uncharacterized membrane protein (UPF0127 family)